MKRYTVLANGIRLHGQVHSCKMCCGLAGGQLQPDILITALAVWLVFNKNKNIFLKCNSQTMYL